MTPLNKRRLRATFAAVAIGGLGAWYFLSRDNDAPLPPAAEYTHHEQTNETVRDLTGRFDRIFRISHEGGQVTAAPIYSQLESFAQSKGMEAEYQSFYTSMEREWIGHGPQFGGGIWQRGQQNDERNIAQGTIAALDANVQATQIQRLADNFVSFTDRLDVRPENILPEWREISPLLPNMFGRTAPDDAANMQRTVNDALTSAMAPLMPDNAGNHSTEFRFLAAYARELGARTGNTTFSDFTSLIGKHLRNDITPGKPLYSAYDRANRIGNVLIVMQRTDEATRNAAADAVKAMPEFGGRDPQATVERWIQTLDRVKAGLCPVAKRSGELGANTVCP